MYSSVVLIIGLAIGNSRLLGNFVTIGIGGFQLQYWLNNLRTLCLLLNKILTKLANFNKILQFFANFHSIFCFIVCL